MGTVPQLHSSITLLLKGKGNVKPAHAINSYGELQVLLHAFLTSVTNGGEWLASHPGRLTFEKRVSNAHRICGQVVSDSLNTEKIF